MVEELTYYKNNTSLLLAFKIIMATLASLMLLYILAKLFQISRSKIYPNKSLVIFIEIFIALKFFCTVYIGEVFQIFYYLIDLPVILLRIVFLIPCASFTIILSRFIYTLLDLYFNLGSDIELSDTKAMKILKIIIIAYASINFFIRIIVACSGNRSWMINGSCSDTLLFLSYFFTILTGIFMIISSALVYKKINEVFMKSLGTSMLKNIKMIVSVLLVCTFCYWLALGLAFISRNDEDLV